MTDGILLAEIQTDRELRAVRHDHHRRGPRAQSLNIDFLLGYLAQLLPRRPDLKVIITSATIDPERFSRHFGDAPIVEVSGRTYPVEVRYRPLLEEDARGDADRDQITAICDAVDELQAEGPGDILVFLSGEREIRDTADALDEEATLPRTPRSCPLYARLSHAEQHRVFQRAHRPPDRAGHQRRRDLPHRPGHQVRHRPGHRPHLPLQPPHQGPAPARSSAISPGQRQPAQGPLRPHLATASASGCTREDDFLARPEFTDAGDPPHQPGLRHPADDRGRPRRHREVPLHRPAGPPQHQGRRPAPRRSWARWTRRRRTRASGSPQIGRKLAQLPVDPRLARMVLEADKNGCVREVMVIAAALSIQDPRERPADKQQQADQQHARFKDETQRLPRLPEPLAVRPRAAEGAVAPPRSAGCARRSS